MTATLSRAPSAHDRNAMADHSAIDTQLMVDLLAEAADTLHRPGPLQVKFDWAVTAVLDGANASAAAYVDLQGPRRVRASAGISAREAQVLVERSGDLLRRVEGTGLAQTDVRDPRPGAPAVVAVPVPKQDASVHGAFLLVLREGQAAEQPTWAAQSVAGHLGTSLDNTATIHELSEMEAAQREVVTQLQESLRPPLPDFAEADLGVYFLSADQTAPTGGDFYDWHLLPDGRLYMSVVDVVGKGITATKDALVVTHAIRMLVLERVPLDEVVARADGILASTHPDLVATLVMAVFDPATGELEMAGAGHPPALVISADGRVEAVNVPGVPIGWPEAGSRALRRRTLGRDDAVVLYTDGLVETSGNVLEGFAHLRSTARDVAQYPARFLARSLVRRAVAGGRRRDDALALVARRRIPMEATGRVLGPFRYRFSASPATVPLVRHLLSDWLELQPVDPGMVDDILFVCTELCANAVRAASGAPGSVELRTELDGDAIVLEVEDDGDGFQMEPVMEQPDAELEAGRGLFLVRALTDELESRRQRDRTVIRCVKRAVVVGDAPP